LLSLYVVTVIQITFYSQANTKLFSVQTVPAIQNSHAL